MFAIQARASNGIYEGRALNGRVEMVLPPLDVDRCLEEFKKQVSFGPDNPTYQ